MIYVIPINSTRNTFNFGYITFCKDKKINLYVKCRKLPQINLNKLDTNLSKIMEPVGTFDSRFKKNKTNESSIFKKYTFETNTNVTLDVYLLGLSQWKWKLSELVINRYLKIVNEPVGIKAFISLKCSWIEIFLKISEAIKWF